jgi:uncharacterized membrane protein
MLPSPLHPALVHFPVVLMVFLPLVAAGALLAIRRGVHPLTAWAFPAGLAALLTISAFVALRTGEAEEERVEDKLAKQAIETHEEAAERFLVFSGFVVVIMAAGLARGGIGRAARVAGLTGALALTFAGYQVGHSGGRVVYGDGTTPGLVAAGDTGAGESGDDDD